MTDLPLRETASPADFAAPLHVLTLTPFYPSAEDDTRGCFVAESLPGLARNGVAHTILAVQPFHRGRVHTAPGSASAHWVYFAMLPGNWGLAWSGALLYASILPRVRRIHAANPIRLIHAHAALPCGHAALLLGRELGIPYVITVHGLDAYLTNQVHGIPGKWCERVCREVYRSAARVICISEKVRERVIAGAATPLRTAVVYNGVDPQIFSPPDKDGVGTAILSVGNLIPIKGHELLLRAFADLPQRYSHISCDIVGDGPELSHLRSLAVSLGVESRVRFLGRQSRSQVAEAMRRCVVFALPSRYEGLGCVYLEAMSAGRPTIACRGQGMDEIIQHGINGWLVEPEDLSGLASALGALVAESPLRQRVGESARSTILQSLTLAHQAAALARLYRECAAAAADTRLV